MKQNIATFIRTQKQTNIHDSDVDNVFESIYSTIMTKIWKYQVEGSGKGIYLM